MKKLYRFLISTAILASSSVVSAAAIKDPKELIEKQFKEQMDLARHYGGVRFTPIDGKPLAKTYFSNVLIHIVKTKADLEKILGYREKFKEICEYWNCAPFSGDPNSVEAFVYYLEKTHATITASLEAAPEDDSLSTGGGSVDGSSTGHHYDQAHHGGAADGAVGGDGTGGPQKMSYDFVTDNIYGPIDPTLSKAAIMMESAWIKPVTEYNKFFSDATSHLLLETIFKRPLIRLKETISQKLSSPTESKAAAPDILEHIKKLKALLALMQIALQEFITSCPENIDGLKAELATAGDDPLKVAIINAKIDASSSLKSILEELAEASKTPYPDVKYEWSETTFFGKDMYRLVDENEVKYLHRFWKRLATEYNLIFEDVASHILLEDTFKDTIITILKEFKTCTEITPQISNEEFFPIFKEKFSVLGRKVKATKNAINYFQNAVLSEDEEETLKASGEIPYQTAIAKVEVVFPLKEIIQALIQTTSDATEE